MEATFFTELDN